MAVNIIIRIRIIIIYIIKFKVNFMIISMEYYCVRDFDNTNIDGIGLGK